MYSLGEVDFPVKYAYVIRTLWLTCFYAPFAPVVVPISMFGLIFFYFTEAELFRTSYRAPNMLSISITRTAIRLMDYTGVVLAGGQILIVFYIKFIFGSKFTLAEQIGVALCVGLSIVLIALPSQKINAKLFPFDNDLDDEIDYDAALKEFEITYEGTNPLSDPSEKVRKNDHNLLKFLNVFDIFQARKSRSLSNANKSSPNPLLNMFSQPNEFFASNQSNDPNTLNPFHQFNQLGNQLL